MLVYKFNPVKQNCMELVRVSLGVILYMTKVTFIKNYFRERNSAADMLAFIRISETLRQLMSSVCVGLQPSLLPQKKKKELRMDCTL